MKQEKKRLAETRRKIRKNVDDCTGNSESKKLLHE